MNNVIYEEIVRKFDETLDIDSPPEVLVTKESNGFAVWYSNDHDGKVLIEYFLNSKEKAIREAIKIIDKMRLEVK